MVEFPPLTRAARVRFPDEIKKNYFSLFYLLPNNEVVGCPDSIPGSGIKIVLGVGREGPHSLKDGCAQRTGATRGQKPTS
jgi:hypothetical protein